MSKYDCSKCLDYEHEHDRMCLWNCNKCGDCNKCGLYKLDSPCRIPDMQKKIDIVQKWSDENPEHPEKTILEDLKEKYPNYSRDPDGIPCTCAGYLYDGNKTSDGCPRDNDCWACWNRPLSEVMR